jgi:hypothetical protein
MIICVGTAMQAQTPAPKPDPELTKLHVWVGHWTVEGEDEAGPLGPGGKVTGEYVGQMILGGFFYQGRWTLKEATGEERGLEIDGYDPVNKNFVSSWYMDNGSTFSGVLTVSKNTHTYAGKLVWSGKQYLEKDTFIFAPDLMSATEKDEISVDGKTWTPSYEGKYTKAQPAPKK